jgi:hypothetical protein
MFNRERMLQQVSLLAHKIHNAHPFRELASVDDAQSHAQ